MIEPLCITERVDCSVEHAFETWTVRFGTWWPRGHTVSGAPDVEVILEPRVGGRIFERTPGGAETDWGEITVWEAPRRIAYLWHIRRDRADATQVEITFAPAPGGGTRVQIVHAGWERLGTGAEAWRDANRGGWSGLLPLPRRLRVPVARPAVERRVTQVEQRSAPMSDPQGNGTPASPWRLTTPPGRSEFEAYRDEASDPPALVVQVGKTQLRYHLRCITDLHEMLKAHDDWMPLGNADEQKPAAEGTVEAWARSPRDPVGGWYGLKKGLRGRFGNYVPPVLERLGLAELEHAARNNRMRAI